MRLTTTTLVLVGCAGDVRSISDHVPDTDSYADADTDADADADADADSDADTDTDTAETGTPTCAEEPGLTPIVTVAPGPLTNQVALTVDLASPAAVAAL